MNKLSYSRRLYLKAQIKFFLILFTLIAILLLDIVYGIGRANFTIEVFEMLFIFAIGYMFYPLYQFLLGKLFKTEDKIIKDMDNAELGFKGEETVSGWLKQILSAEEYIILPNVVLPNHRYDIDFIVIGPKGIIILEVKNFTGKFHFSNDEYFEIKNGKKNALPPFFDPREQVKKQTFDLREYFELKGHGNARILKALVFVNKDSITIDGNTGIYVVNSLDSLKNFFDNITLDINYTPEYCEKIRQILSV